VERLHTAMAPGFGLAGEEALDEHSHEDTLDHDAADRLNGGDPGREGERPQLFLECAPMQRRQADEQRVACGLDA
jgi:hypothetical protein